MAQNILYLNDSNFENTIAKGVTMVDFYADWCGPCRTIAPVIEELSNEFHGQAKIAKLDIEQSQVATANWQVTMVPTVIIFKEGKEVSRVVGIKDKKGFSKILSDALTAPV
jgi:thioredoxin 1